MGLKSFLAIRAGPRPDVCFQMAEKEGTEECGYRTVVIPVTTEVWL